jgi:hypothetical protein
VATAKSTKKHGFHPGKSGNPAGRPAGSRNKATLAIEAPLLGVLHGAYYAYRYTLIQGHLRRDWDQPGHERQEEFWVRLCDTSEVLIGRVDVLENPQHSGLHLSCLRQPPMDGAPDRRILN